MESFEKKLLSGNLIDTAKLKQSRPSWLDPPRIPRIYRDLEALVSVPTGADVNGDQSSLDTAKVYQVLLASGLPQQILASIWDQCSKSIPGSLERHEFYQALALVALTQAGNQPNVQLLANLQNAPIPQLAIAGYPLPLANAVQSQSSHGVNSQPTQPASIPILSQEPCSAQLISSEQGAAVSDATQRAADDNAFFKQQSMPDQPVEEEDDFADFQSAPSEVFPIKTVKSASINNGISVPEFSVTKPVIQEPLVRQHVVATNGLGVSHDLGSTSHIISSSTCQKSPKSTIVASSPKQPKLLPSASLFDSIAVPVAENVQPPSENSPWLGFSLDTPKQKPSKRTTKKETKEILPAPAASDNTIESLTVDNGIGPPKSTEEEFDDFNDFQSAPVNNIERVPDSVSGMDLVNDIGSRPNQDKYSVFRILDESPEQSSGVMELSNESEAPAVEVSLEIEAEVPLQDSASTPATPQNKSDCESPKDILSLIKLPSIPALDDTCENDLSQFDSLSLSSKDKVTNENSTSALIELQDLDIGFTAVDGPVASHPSSVEVSPAKSVASGQSIGESRGREHRLSIFTNKGNYAECASLSSLEMGPSTESNYSSPTKGSVMSLELNSRSPPDDENADEDDTLEWTIESDQVVQAPEEPSEKQRKGSDEFCWAQPPMFPPPDPTDSEKTSALLNTGLFLQNFPETQKKKVTRQQVAEGWHRILSKAVAILESASVILGNDPVVLGEILSTPKGQSYIASLLEVYNVTQQLKKSADLHGVEGLGAQLQQVDATWRGKLDDLATRLHLSVVCMDHLSSPIRAVDEICAICSLPLNLRLPQILFGDNGYHSSCANFWANVLAEGLPCLKLSP